MSKQDRIIVYLVGFGIGLLLVTMILSRRAAQNEQVEDPWLRHQQEAAVAGAEPIPEAAPVALRAGRLLSYGMLPEGEEPREKVWLLNFKESYPYVRVVQSLITDEIVVTAADQVVIRLAKNVDVTALKPALDELGLRLRNFNRKERIAVIGVLNTNLDAVPKTIEALQPWSELFESVSADPIKFRERPFN
ncbi:MAG: hypothetical protein AAF546_02295 [Verrucomicrobiota bacterium]